MAGRIRAALVLVAVCATVGVSAGAAPPGE